MKGKDNRGPRQERPTSGQYKKGGGNTGRDQAKFSRSNDYPQGSKSNFGQQRSFKHEDKREDGFSKRTFGKPEDSLDFRNKRWGQNDGPRNNSSQPKREDNFKKSNDFRSESKFSGRFGNSDKPNRSFKEDRGFDRRDPNKSNSFRDAKPYGEKRNEFSSRKPNFKSETNESFGRETRPFEKDNRNEKFGRSGRPGNDRFTNKASNFEERRRYHQPDTNERFKSDSNPAEFGRKEGNFRSFNKKENEHFSHKPKNYSEDRRRDQPNDKFRNNSDFNDSSKSYQGAKDNFRTFGKFSNEPRKRFEKKDKNAEGFHYGKNLEPGKRPDYSEENLFNKIPAKKQAKLSAGKPTDTIRLNRYIANAGLCSRREADDLIASGQITVNGQEITEMGYQVQPSDVVKYGRKILNREKLVYVLLNKPKDFITTTEDPEGRRTVMELLSKVGPERIYPVGRLDRATTGLLLFTNDGELADKLAHPSHEIRKIYQAEINKPITTEDFEKLSNGIELEDGFIKPDVVSIVTPDKQVIGIEIHSGKNRVVRRIFEHLGYEVTQLDRTTYAGLTKKELPRGNWRYLTEKEVIRLKYLQ